MSLGACSPGQPLLDLHVLCCSAGSAVSAAQERVWGEASQDLPPITWWDVQCGCPGCPPAFWLAAVRNSPASRICSAVPASGCMAGPAPAAPPCVRSSIYTIPWCPSLDKQLVTTTACRLGGEGGAVSDWSPRLPAPSLCWSLVDPCSMSQGSLSPEPLFALKARHQFGLCGPAGENSFTLKNRLQLLSLCLETKGI